jgi:hypothetical protein
LVPKGASERPALVAAATTASATAAAPTGR